MKTSLGPGSLVVTDYLKKAGVLDDLEKLGFYVVGYGCTTCIGNSGPLPDEVSKGIAENDLVVASVLSGNRNFEGRVHPEVKMNYLASPPLVVAYALAGTVDIDLTTRAARAHGATARPCSCATSGRRNKEIGDIDRRHGRPGAVRAELRRRVQGRLALEPDRLAGRRILRAGTRPRPTSRTRPTSTA